MSIFGPTKDQYEALERRIKYLEDALSRKAENQIGVGEKTKKYGGGWTYYDHDHYVTVEEAIQKLAAHQGVEFVATKATPAVVTLEKPQSPIYFTGTVTAPESAKKRKAK